MIVTWIGCIAGKSACDLQSPFPDQIAKLKKATSKEWNGSIPFVALAEQIGIEA